MCTLSKNAYIIEKSGEQYRINTSNYLLGEGVGVFDLTPSEGDGHFTRLGLGILSRSSGISFVSSYLFQSL